MARAIPWLPQATGKRWLVLFAIGGYWLVRKVVVTTLVPILSGFLLWQIPSVQGWIIMKMMRREMRQPVEFPPAPALSAQEAARLATNVLVVHSAAELFRPTNVWDVHLKFSSNQWFALGPNAVPPVLNFIQPDGSVVLRNPAASRNGLAGVFGIDFPWSTGGLDFANAAYPFVSARFKGNGTFVNSQRSFKRPFKIDLNDWVKSQCLGGRTKLNFHNLVSDASCLSDTLGYEFYRQAGVPASRTTFARLRLTLGGRFENRLLGLYVIVENPDAEWARDRFGVDGMLLFKPVTYELFKDLGGDWKAYAGLYDPKSRPDAGQQRRIIDLAKLVTHASDAEFTARIGEFIDLDEFARFLACEVMLANYDSILSNGQNFLLYLDPRTDRLGFIPWDLDQSWGAFPLVGPVESRERASLWHPWIGENRFLERMLAAAPFRERYRRELERLLATAFRPDQLARRVDELAVVVRPFVAEESPGRLSRFEHAVAGESPAAAAKATAADPRPGPYSLKRFFRERAASVRDQLDGRAEGVVMVRRDPRRR